MYIYVGIFETPVIDHATKTDAFPITVICDNIREPGNLGTMLRTITAVGASQIILMKGEFNLTLFNIKYSHHVKMHVFNVYLRLYGYVGR